MTQTKFVLSKALKAKLKPIVVLNKMDRKDRIRVDEVETELFDLFCTLEANDQQMNYPTLYASAVSNENYFILTFERGKDGQLEKEMIQE